MTAALDTILSQATAAGEVPGVVAMVADRDGVRYAGAFGERRLGGGVLMTADTVTWIASMTKAVTTAALLQLVEEGKVALDAPAATYAPEIGEALLLHDFDTDGRPLTRKPARPVTIRHLLTHTAGYSYDFASSALRKYMKATGLPATNTGKLASLGAPLVGEPGEAFIYGISTDWAGRIVEIVTGKPLETVFRERVFAPLGMTDSMFRLGPDQMARRATVHGVTEDGTYVPTDMVVVQDPEFVSGGGGLYATAGDYLTFLRMILAGGSLDGARILSPESIAGLMTDQIPALSVPALGLMSPMGLRSADFFGGKPTGWTLGFQQNRVPTAEGRPAGSLSWAGFANTFYWIDPHNGIAGLFLTQIMPFFDPRAIKLFRAFETEVYRTVA
ncbi:MAG: serine hydrolase domain-containing protein [Phreatobacter sp.]|uniref:serine hydrolase domain-containing protein n=1 Tax=Phreatobacter sp. TaxID=1966341 RepID=UPI0027335CA3|nr:serine hydrolase domain-containing protein [Phreatobacter sp.]MDP2801781.1 serine hydrolase domain-containing protein [Phreatobacter sp.]